MILHNINSFHMENRDLQIIFRKIFIEIFGPSRREHADYAFDHIYYTQQDDTGQNTGQKEHTPHLKYSQGLTWKWCLYRKI